LRPSIPLRIANVYTPCPYAESDTLGSPTSPPQVPGCVETTPVTRLEQTVWDLR